MDVEADVASLDRRRLAGVDAHAHADLVVARPVVPGERLLRFRRGRDRLGGRCERDEERVALRVDDVAAVAVERSGKDTPVLGEQLRIRVAGPLQESSRSLDVAEEERDGSGGEVGHGGLRSVASGQTWRREPGATRYPAPR